MTQKLQVIKDRLDQRLRDYRLAERIYFDESALEELYRLSSGNLGDAELYAGTAVLDALQHQRKEVSQADILAVDIAEAMVLILDGKDIWDDVRYIGINVPDMFPEGVQLRRALSGFDAVRSRATMVAINDGRLPPCALTDLIQYEQKMTSESEVRVPFKYDLLKDEVRAVAENFARFVSQYTGEPQEVKDISQGNDTFGIQYSLQQQTQGDRHPLLNSPNYLVAKSFAFGIKGAQGVVTISRDMLCKHDQNTLEAYVNSLKPQGR